MQEKIIDKVFSSRGWVGCASPNRGLNRAELQRGQSSRTQLALAKIKIPLSIHSVALLLICFLWVYAFLVLVLFQSHGARTKSTGSLFK